MKFLIANDLHLGSKHATHTLDEVLDKVLEIVVRNTGATTVFNGDIVDMANCERKKVEYWKKELDWFAKKITEIGGTFIRGNHELNQVEAPDFVIIDNVYFNHGDYFFWSKEKADAYRAKKPGAGFLKRWVTPIYDKLRHLKDAGPNENFYKEMDKVIAANPTIRAACFAHRHPRENIIFDYRGVKCYILKRGIQELDI